jgi:hypothetical protein
MFFAKFFHHPAEAERILLVSEPPLMPKKRLRARIPERLPMAERYSGANRRCPTHFSGSSRRIRRGDDAEDGKGRGVSRFATYR